ncbi:MULTISPECIES: hypothetical protein [unclassified Clostridium]|uniref:hypothetical protein n=1 Tax=unclassified Clostridium TaxID=2614128 RepID=UPI0002977E3D|nr:MULTISPECIES: hypothetical protein [unclassified Clostridium]EKQ52669.1 MAG: hypothetical protein A370_04089 [Clostridium sp. Maddingley MBC34-26]
MGNIIKINLYAENKNKKKNNLNLQAVEDIIQKYNSWLKKNNREDKIETYEEFLQVQ